MKWISTPNNIYTPYVLVYVGDAILNLEKSLYD